MLEAISSESWLSSSSFSLSENISNVDPDDYEDIDEIELFANYSENGIWFH